MRFTNNSRSVFAMAVYALHLTHFVSLVCLRACLPRARGAPAPHRPRAEAVPPRPPAPAHLPRRRLSSPPQLLLSLVVGRWSVVGRRSSVVGRRATTAARAR